MNATKTTRRGTRKATPAPRAARATSRRHAAPAAAPANDAEFFARAWAMEVEAVERYSMLADAMEEHNNPEVTELFRKLARIEQLHADRILEENPSVNPQQVVAPQDIQWESGEGPETADPGDLHYRMQPYHALQMALTCEQQANRFFVKMARAASSASVRKAALEMAAEEEEHVQLIEDWIKRTPPPDKDWEYDPDPPSSPD